MAFCDFVVKYDPEKDTSEDLTKRILYSVIIKRLKANKPTICFIGGESGEGKSLTALRLTEILLEIQGLELEKYFDLMNIYTPLQYPEKIDKILFDKEYKKANILIMHEAREIIKAKQWHSFLTQSVADVNAMSRQVKRLCLMIVSQFIRDITNDMRYTLNYYMIVKRPKGKKARLYFHVLWKDDRDLDKPKLRKRKLSGYLVYPNGRYRRLVPQYFEMSKPSKKTEMMFEEADRASKTVIIKNKLSKLMAEMKADVGELNNKVNAMVEWYMKHPDNLNLIGKQHKNGWRINKEIREMHDLSREEAIDFEKSLNTNLRKQGFFKEETQEELLDNGETA